MENRKHKIINGSNIQQNISANRLSKRKKIDASLFQHVMDNLFPFHIAPFVSAKDTLSLSSTSKVLHSIANDEMVWKNRFLEDFGQLHFKEDYKQQYIAEYLLKQFPHHPTKYISQLRAHIKPFSNKSWTFFYMAWCALKARDDDSNLIKYALASFASGDIRSGFLLFNYFINQLVEGNRFDAEKFNQFFVLLSTYDNRKTTKVMQLEALKNCFLFKSYNNLEFKKRSLELFFAALDPNEKEVDWFIGFSIYLLETLGVINTATSTKIINKINFNETNTVLEAVMLLLNCPELLSKRLAKRFISWLEAWAAKGHITAEYYYADYLRNSLLATMILHPNSLSTDEKNRIIEKSKSYYFKAIAGKEYRAICSHSAGGIGGLFSLAGLRQNADLVDKDTFNNMLLAGVRHGDRNCVLTAAVRVRSERTWDKSLMNIWLQQLAAFLTEPYGEDCYKALQHKASSPEANPHVYCALALIYLKEANEEKAQQTYSFIMSIDPTLPDKYIAAGKKYGFCLALHEEGMKNLANHAKQDEAIIQTHRRIKHY